MNEWMDASPSPFLERAVAATALGGHNGAAVLTLPNQSSRDLRLGVTFRAPAKG